MGFIILWVFLCGTGNDLTHVPSWVWVAAGLFNFLAYTLGKCVFFVFVSKLINLF